MESGFGQNLEGFLIKGNLSLAPAEIPYLQGDGSIEGSGTLYINKITEYDLNNGLDIQDIIIKDKSIYVPYQKESANLTTASFIIEGGIAVKNTANATSLSCGGGVTIAGGASIGKNLYVGGQVDVSSNRIVNVLLPVNGADAANKEYVDSVANKLSGNFTTGQVIIAENDGYAIRGYDSFKFSGNSLLLDTPFFITNSTPATDTSTGSLVVSGGLGVVGDTYLGSILDLGGNIISNVAYPTESTDVANKQYVDDHKLSGNFTTGQLIIAASIGDAIRGYENLIYDGYTIHLESTSNITGSIGGAFVCYGGISISKDVFVGGKLDVNNNNIINVADPTDPQHAATKAYVDSKTYGNLLGNFQNQQVVIATTDPSSLTGYSNFLYDGSQLSLGSNGSFLITNTSDASFLTYGGIDIHRGLNVGGTVNINNNTILNVATPVNALDAANKEYVDSVASKLSGNFTTGQVIIADSNGDSIRGFDNITFLHYLSTSQGSLVLSNNTNILIFDTTNAVGHGTGGSFTTDGGGSFGKELYIGGTTYVNYNNIKEVADPIDDYDAVNKRYLDEVISSLAYGNSFTMQNNTTGDIPNFYFQSQVKAFVANVLVKYNDTNCAIFTIYGSHSGSRWLLNTSYVGDQTGVSFDVRTAGGAAYIQYNNTNTYGVASLRFKTSTQIDTASSTVQTNHTLTANVLTPESLPGMVYEHSVYDCIQFIGHIASDTDNKYTLFVLNVVKTDGNVWKRHIITLGDDTGVDLSVANVPPLFNTVQLQYTNKNNAGDYILRVKKVEVKTSQTSITLLANTLVSTPITHTSLHYANTDYVFNNMVYVSVPDLDKYAMYHLAGLYCVDDGWRINARYIGDYTGIQFQITTDSGVGKLSYTNKNNVDAYIRVYNSPPFAIEPLPVNKGGTGTDYLLPYGVLRGDGTNPIVATDDFIYKDYQLILGPLSSIVLNNTQNATSNTFGGTFTSAGGGSFAKDLFIGGTTYTSYNNIKEVADPIEDYDAVNKKYVDFIDITTDINDDRIEYTYNLSNNTSVPLDIPNLEWDSDIKAFITNIHVEYNNEVCGLYSIHGINTGSSWTISAIFTGQQTGVGFNIKTDAGKGILQYTNKNTTGIAYIRYKTTIQVYTSPTDSLQSNHNLLPNVTHQDITPLTFSNSEFDSLKFIIYVSSELDNRYGMFLVNCILKGSVWYINTHSIGNIEGIKFDMSTQSGNGVVQYSNSNTSSDYMIRVKKYEIPSSQTEIKLDHNTMSPAVIDSDELSFPNSDNYFQISVFVFVPDLQKYALFEIRGVFCNGMWTSHSRYIGDYTGVKFFISGEDKHGKLSFTNSNTSEDAYIRFIKNAPLASLKPLAINKGGTASSYLNPYAVLRGNGVNPIVGTNDFIYKDYQLILGDMSSIVIQNTNANTFVVYGGISIDKEVVVGERLVVNNNDITPNEGDINAERSFYAANNQTLPQNVDGFDLGSSTKSFSGIISISVTTLTDVYDSLFEIKGIKRSSGTWILDYNSIGDSIGIDFSITPGGQIQYTSTNVHDWSSTLMKFRAITTTV